MIKTYTTIFLASALLSSSLFAKEKVTTPKKTYTAQWQKVYGQKDDDIANAVIMLEGGHTAVAGTCKSFNAERSDICVTRLNEKGQTIWRKMLGGKKTDKAVAISRAKDGNLLVLGDSKSFKKHDGQDIYVAKVSLDGKLIWENSLGGDRDDFAAGIAGTDDGGALLVGDSESFSKKGYRDIYIVRLDKNGKMLTGKTIGGKLNDEANALTRTADGNFIMAGSREIRSSGDADFFLMKLNQKGEKIWARTLGEKYNDVLHAIAPTPDGGIVATGKTRSYNSAQTDLPIMHFNKDGKLIWFKIYGFAYYDEGNAITMTKDGNYMVAGRTNSMGKGNFDNYVLSLDRKGQLLWSGMYGGENQDVAHGITRTTDGAVVIVGESDSYSRSKKFFMIKLK
ncbi:MAG: Unknown protein [uncultured Sulfurovum sp.]|uniref:Uncharacterized protein n=1 Tax=uncultured Sulfurovum sp. TaxID=269237 RepID=A0A6S6S8M2_9BACT|nr:MAG: Unknown protein [uncultured Sulfurovum sp.]